MSSTIQINKTKQIIGGNRTHQAYNFLVKFLTKHAFIGVVVLITAQSVAAKNDEYLDQLIKQAIMNDPGLIQNQAIEAASLSQAELGKYWANPIISVDINNVATDGFNFDQEPMSHLKLGIKQKLPRGNSNTLEQRQHQQLAAAMPQLRAYRKAQLAMQVTTWVLKIKEAQHIIGITLENRAVIADLLSLAEASYKSAYGKTKQQDLIRAQLELTLNEDQQAKYQQQLNSSITELSALIKVDQSQIFIDKKLKNNSIVINTISHSMISLANEDHLIQWQIFSNHPQVLALEQKIKAAATQVELAEQQKKPEYVLSTSYGYRDASPIGQNRADLFSVGITFDLPNLTKNKTSHLVKQKSYELDAVEATKYRLIQTMAQQFQSLLSNHSSLIEREQLYKHKLIPQLQQMAESNISAYAYEGGDFTEVMRSQLASLNAQIQLTQLQTEIKITNMKVNLLLMQDAAQFISKLQSQGTSS